MNEYIKDLHKYTNNIDEGVVVGIVKYLGIALPNRGASLVSCSD